MEFKNRRLGIPLFRIPFLAGLYSGQSRLRTLTTAISVNSNYENTPLHVNTYHYNSMFFDYKLRKFWKVVEVQQNILNPNDDRCKDHFKSTHSGDLIKRYIIHLPSKKNPPIEIGQSRSIAKKSLRNLVRRRMFIPSTLRNTRNSFLNMSSSATCKCFRAPYLTKIFDLSSSSRII